MEIRTIAISRIKIQKYNPRKDLQPDDPEYKMLAKGLNKFGLVEPLIWNKRSGNLVGGHQRLKILKSKKAKKVQVSVVDLPPQKEKALNIALNKLGEGGWDKPRLADLLEELDDSSLDIELTGWNDSEIEALMAEVREEKTGQKGKTTFVKTCPKCGFKF